MTNVDQSPCIGQLEHHLHNVFASQRVPGEDFVYVPSAELFNVLEDFCDDQSIHEPRPPLLILGNSGSGKSAILANWLHRRQRNATRARNSDDFVFWHVVGCTRQSMDVNNLMRRLMIDLKHRFELSRDVSLTQARLSWDLPRFLELAAKKGKIIIVIDGLHRLESHEGENGLSWLPLEFPSNIRVVLSATTGPETSSRQSHILNELDRRRWQVLRIKPLEQFVCRSIIESYIKKTVQDDSSSLAGGVFLTNSAESNAVTSADIPGFLLFDSTTLEIINHKLATKPLFLRIILRCLSWACARGYNLWNLVELWLQAETLEDLYSLILSTLEDGYTCSEVDKISATNNVLNGGGLNALKVLYPWHPSFQKIDQTETNEMLMVDFQFDSSEGGIRASSQKNIDNSNSTMNNTGQQWLVASQAAETKLEAVRIETQRELSNLVQRAQKTAAENNISYIEAFLELQRMQLEEMESESDLESSDDDEDEALCSVLDTSSARVKKLDENSVDNSAVTFEGDLDADASIASNEKVESKDNVFLTAATESADEGGDVATTALRTFEGKPIKIEKHARHTSVDVRGSHRMHATEFDRQSSLPTYPKRHSMNDDASHSASSNDLKRHRFASVDDQNSLDEGEVAADPKEGLDRLPAYLCGGINTQGFHSMLGHALSLLYVARHGLKESELWAILASIQQSELNRDASKMYTAESRALLSVCYQYREQFLDIWRSFDIMHKYILPMHRIFAGIQGVCQDFTEHDFDLLLTLVELKGVEFIDYNDLLQRIIKVEKNSRLSTWKKRSQDNVNSEDLLSVNDAQDPLISATSDNSLAFDSMEDESVFDADGAKSLGPVMEEGLLSCLCALGVLHTPKDQILVLPSESEALRNIILERYIFREDGNKSTIEEWHMKLIKFFQRKKNTLRRCEELPWHLKICRKWFTLKNNLSDLKTFELMCGGHLREELLLYWFTLTKGPLYVSDKAEMEANSANRQQITEHMKILSLLDSAGELNLSEKEVRKQLLKHQVATFDIVDELNKSIEHWIVATRPSANKIAGIVLKVAKFLAEFCRLFETSPFPFLRLAMDLSAFETFSIELDITGDHTDDVDTQDSKSETVVVKRHPDTSIGSGPTLFNEQDAMLYHYLRWMWIQFPWLAMQPRFQVGYANALMQVTDKQRKTALQAVAPPVDETNLHSTRHFHHTLSSPIGLMQSPSLGEMTASDMGSDNRKDKRMWSVKKYDPSSGPVITTSVHRQRAILKSSVTTSMKLEAIEHYSHNLHAGSSTVSSHTVKDKYRISMNDHLKAMQKIPHSKPSNRALANNTLFPSVNNILKEKNPEAVSKTEKSATIDAEINRIKEEEKLRQMNASNAIPDTSMDSAMYKQESERCVRLRNAYDKVCDLRRLKESQLNELKSSAMIRDDIDEAVIAGLESGDATIGALENRYMALQSALSEANQLNDNYSRLITFLALHPCYTERHMSSLEQEVELSKQQVIDLKTYRRSVYEETEAMEKTTNPSIRDKIASIKSERAAVQKKIKHLESVVASLRNQYADLVRSDDKQDNDQARMQLSSAQAAIANTLVGAHRKISVNNQPHQQQTAPEEASAASPPPSPVPAVRPPKMRPDASGFILLNDDSSATSKESDPMTQRHKMLEMLYERSGTSTPEEFIERYKDAHRLHESLKSHQSLAESRLAQLRSESNDLYGTWGDTVFVSDKPSSASGDAAAENEAAPTSSEREMRYLDQRLFASEMKLNHCMRQTEKQVLLINEIRTGILHITSLLTANEKLLQNLPSSTPPSGRTDEVKILAWCEERILAINEALVLDASKPAGIDDSKPLSTRQTELAALVTVLLNNNQPSTSRLKKRLRLLKKGPISMGILNSDTDKADYLKENSVRIPASGTTESIYSAKVDEAYRELEARAEVLEAAEQSSGTQDRTEAMISLLNDAITSNESRVALRRANVLANRKQGSRAGYGWALESIVQSHYDDSYGGPAGSNRALMEKRNRKKRKKEQQSQIMTRAEQKNQANMIRAHNEKLIKASQGEEEGANNANTNTTS